MPIAVNFKICDNSPACTAPPVCKAKAIYFDKQKKSLVIDNSKCVSCGLCVPACPVGAIKMAKDLEDLKKVQKEIDRDPRKVSDLFVDRYGSEPQSEPFFCPHDGFELQVLNATKPVALECFNGDSIHCLVYSIPISRLFEGKDIVYRKFAVEDGSFLEKYGVKELPALLFFSNGKPVGKIEGYFSFENEKELKGKIGKLLRKL